MIIQRELYHNKIARDIAGWHQKLEYTENAQKSFSILGELFNKYRIFQVDTAILIAHERLKVAEKMGEDYIGESLMNIADALNKNGKQEKALEVLAGIKRTKTIQNNTYFYYIYSSIYFMLYNEETDAVRKRYYLKAVKAYTDTLNLIGKPGTFSYAMSKCNSLMQDNRLDEAINLLTDFYNHGNYNILDKASIEHKLGELYQDKYDDEKAKYFFTLSSITDISNGNKVYVSLQHLAMLLFRQGDIERAYNYIFCSLEDIVSSKARYRIVDITKYLNIIEAEHKIRMKSEYHKSLFFFAILSILVAALAGSVFYIRKKNIKLQKTKKLLMEQNLRLQNMANDLTRINENIKESNQIKEEYIGFLFNICSEYIYKQEKIRKSLLKITTTGTMADVSHLLNAQSSSSEDFKAFIDKFDVIFLTLFPDFVDSFNGLLKEGERIELKEGEMLTPELRIYALIRLGINDNSKIANFLHYSLQTVYNYQMKIRNKAIISGKNFISQVQKL